MTTTNTEHIAKSMEAYHHLEPKPLKGSGTFTIIDGTPVSADFTILQYPNETMIVVGGEQTLVEQFNRSIDDNGELILDGVIEPNMPIHAVLRSNKRPERLSNAEFFTKGSVVLGKCNNEPPVEARYPLIGYHDGHFSLVQ